MGSEAMKKYSAKHLESVPPEYIAALEETVDMLSRNGHCDDACPALILENISINYGLCSSDGANWCQDYIGYASDYFCPCYALGQDEAIKASKNLISQWKRWANLED